MKGRFSVVGFLGSTFLTTILITAGSVPASAIRENRIEPSCTPTGSTPTITSVTVDGNSIVNGTSSLPAAGNLYYKINSETSQTFNGACSFQYTVNVMRNYGEIGPGGGWFQIVGLQKWFLDHAAFAQRYDGGYVDVHPVTSSSTVVITMTLPDTGSYTAANIFDYVTVGKFAGDSPMVLDGSTLTITGHPAFNVVSPNPWPNCVPPTFNALADSLSSLSCGDTNSWPPASATDNGYGDSGPFGPSGSIAQVASRGLQFNVRTDFAPTLDAKSEVQRGMWFETPNTPRWTINYSNSDAGPSLQLGMGNYHEYYAGLANTVTLNTGSLRFMMPDAWTALGFGVTSDSDPALIDGVIQVARTESGTTSTVSATLTPVSGDGIIVDVGSLGFSSPTYTTNRNNAVKATIAGTKVKLSFSLTTAQVSQAKKKVTVFAGPLSELTAVKTFKVVKGKNTLSVVYVEDGGYTVRLGDAAQTVLGSAIPTK